MSAGDQVAETQRLATAAYEASGAKTHGEFTALFGDALPLRTFRRWLGGHGRADALAQLLLREFAAGWRPGPARPHTFEDGSVGGGRDD